LRDKTWRSSFFGELFTDCSEGAPGLGRSYCSSRQRSYDNEFHPLESAHWWCLQIKLSRRWYILCLVFGSISSIGSIGFGFGFGFGSSFKRRLQACF
jgi:hypothetical protein